MPKGKPVADSHRPPPRPRAGRERLGSPDPAPERWPGRDGCWTGVRWRTYPGGRGPSFSGPGSSTADRPSRSPEAAPPLSSHSSPRVSGPHFPRSILDAALCDEAARRCQHSHLFFVYVVVHSPLLCTSSYTDTARSTLNAALWRNGHLESVRPGKADIQFPPACGSDGLVTRCQKPRKHTATPWPPVLLTLRVDAVSAGCRQLPGGIDGKSSPEGHQLYLAIFRCSGQGSQYVVGQSESSEIGGSSDGV